jgi:hypothetical protein
MYYNEQSLYNITIFNPVMAYMYKGPFFHCGMIVIYNNTPYVLELSEADIFCNFDNKIAHYVPSLSSMDEFDSYNGMIVRYPYIGPTISDESILNVLKEKNRFVHAWHPDYGLIKNAKYYLYNMPDYDTCGPEIKKVTDSDCPYYVNCVQYICALMRQMGISNKYCMKTTPASLSNLCDDNKNYDLPHIIKNSYLLNYI